MIINSFNPKLMFKLCQEQILDRNFVGNKLWFYRSYLSFLNIPWIRTILLFID